MSRLTKCHRCSGIGLLSRNVLCPNCEGTGTIVEDTKEDREEVRSLSRRRGSYGAMLDRGFALYELNGGT